MTGMCLFCRIARKEQMAEALYENNRAIAVLDIKPIAPGHAMILSKTHAETILDLPAEDVPYVWQAVAETVRLLRAALAPDGFTIGINHGRASGQTIEHLHIHVIPRFTDDGGTSLHGIVQNRPHETVGEIAARIRAAGRDAR